MRKKSRQRIFTKHESIKEEMLLCKYDLVKLNKTAKETVTNLQQKNPYVVIVAFKKGTSFIEVMYPNGYKQTYPKSYVNPTKRISVHNALYLNHISQTVHDKLQEDTQFNTIVQTHLI